MYVWIQLAMNGLAAENYVVFDAAGDGREELALLIGLSQEALVRENGAEDYFKAYYDMQHR